jgi:hypothetical protein
MSITEGPSGETYLHCFRGCSIDDIMRSKGLKLSDLFADTKPYREALALAEKLRAKAERERKEQRRIERWKIDHARKWEACRDALGFLLMQHPGDCKLLSLFHHSCNMTRDLPSVGLSTATPIAGVFPPRHPLDGITAQDVGRQVAAYLKLPLE